MRQMKIAAMLCAVLVQGSVHAATYLADIVGTGTHQDEFGDQPITWTGQVKVVTDGSSDGTYTGATLESITVVTDVFQNVFDWSYTKGQTQVPWEYLPGLFLPVGPEPGASVTLAGGLLAGVNLIYDDMFTVDTMSGMNVAAQTVCRTNLCHGGPDNYVVSGTLTASASTVPEPANPALLLAGLGLAGLVARRRKA